MFISFALNIFFYICRPEKTTVDVAQLVRALVCGTKGRGFEPHPPPENKKVLSP